MNQLNRRLAVHEQSECGYSINKSSGLKKKKIVSQTTLALLVYGDAVYRLLKQISYIANMNNRNELGIYLTSLGLTGRGVEVGSNVGEFAEVILSNWGGTLYMIDPWRTLGHEFARTSPAGFDEKLRNNALHAFTAVEKFGERAVPIRTFSKTAIDLFPDESLDFVYIDANHEYHCVLEDIELWFPKVKKGGVVSGHDYITSTAIENKWVYSEPIPGQKNVNLYYMNRTFCGIFGVNAAVEDFCDSHGYKFETTHPHPTVPGSEIWSSWYFRK